MLVIGIDENGLGPLLGPLVVTGTVFESDDYDIERFSRLAGPDLPAADSKILFSRRSPAAGERAIRSWIELFGCRAGTFADLVEDVCLPLPFPVPCPGGVIPIPCETTGIDLPLWAQPGTNTVSMTVKDRFNKAGVEPGSVGSFMMCAGALNLALQEPDANKMRLDFELMMKLAMRLTHSERGEAIVLCGKIGSAMRYGRWFEGMNLSVDSVIRESREVSTYRVSGIGEVSFIRSGDSIHLPISVASMVGKYLRELAMERLNTTLGWNAEMRASGYRDRITARFVEQTVGIRRDMGLASSCFTRRS